MDSFKSDESGYQNGWIFGKVPNGLWHPSPPHFQKIILQFFPKKPCSKICNINFWIENDPLPPIVTFPKVQPILVPWPVPKPIKLEFRASVELPCCVCISCLVCNFLHLLCPLCHTELRCIPLAVCFVQLLCCVCNCISGAVCFLLWAVCTP